MCQWVEEYEYNSNKYLKSEIKRSTSIYSISPLMKSPSIENHRHRNKYQTNLKHLNKTKIKLKLSINQQQQQQLQQQKKIISFKSKNVFTKKSTKNKSERKSISSFLNTLALWLLLKWCCCCCWWWCC